MQHEEKSLAQKRFKLMAEIIAKCVPVISAVLTAFSKDLISYNICLKIRIDSDRKQMIKLQHIWDRNNVGIFKTLLKN